MKARTRFPIQAFSLVEVMVAVAILTVLATVTFSIARSVRERTSVGRCTQNLRLIHNALQLYRADWGNAQSNVGDIGRLGLPPAMHYVFPGPPIIGEPEWQVCDSPKAPNRTSMPDYGHFFWVREYAGRVIEPPYEDVTAVYKERTPVVYDVNHIDHATTNIYQPRTRKFVLFVDLGGSLVNKTTTSFFRHPRDVGFFEIE